MKAALRRASSHLPKPPQRAMAGNAVSIKSRPPLVLVVDGLREMRELASAILGHYAGVRTLQAAKNATALRMMRRYSIGVVVSNLFRAGGNGFDLLKLCRKMRLGIPVVIWSGCTDAIYRREAKRLGAIAFLPKAGDGRDLAKVVADALRVCRSHVL